MLNKMNKNRRVVITGLGVVSSIGIGWQEFWKNCINGKSGISKIESFDTSQYDRHYGGEIKNFSPEKFIDRRKLKVLGRASQLAIAASKLALEDAKIDIVGVDKERVGVCLGTTMGEAQTMELIDQLWLQKGENGIDSELITKYPSNAISSNISFDLKSEGCNYLFPNACSAGNHSISFASDLIKVNEVDMVIAGGADAFSRINMAGFSRIFAMAPEKCQPFDKNRQGMLAGEGSGIVILESLDSALERKAEIYAEVLGCGLSCDAYHMTAPTTFGITKCFKNALTQSEAIPEEVDYICAHGTGTIQNDKAECAAIKKAFGGNYKDIPISSIKSMLGHTMGAASAIEAIVCCLTIKKGIIPPTINYETPDSDCDIDCVPNKARKKNVNVAMNNSSAFGGNNACLVLRKYD